MGNVTATRASSGAFLAHPHSQVFFGGQGWGPNVRPEASPSSGFSYLSIGEKGRGQGTLGSSTHSLHVMIPVLHISQGYSNAGKAAVSAAGCEWVLMGSITNTNNISVALGGWVGPYYVGRRQMQPRNGRHERRGWHGRHWGPGAPRGRG